MFIAMLWMLLTRSFLFYVAKNFAMYRFNAAGVTVFHTSFSIKDSKQGCFGFTHNMKMNYVQLDKYHLGSSGDINRVVGDEVLGCESAMDLTGFFKADMVTRSIS